MRETCLECPLVSDRGKIIILEEVVIYCVVSPELVPRMFFLPHLSESTAGGHTHSRFVLHEPEAPAALHQKGHEEISQGDSSCGERERSDAHGGV